MYYRRYFLLLFISSEGINKLWTHNPLFYGIVGDFRSKTAATLASILFFATFFPYYYVGGDAQSSVAVKTWASLLAPTCLALGSDTFAAYEGGKPKVSRSSLPRSTLTYLEKLLVVV